MMIIQLLILSSTKFLKLLISSLLKSFIIQWYTILFYIKRIIIRGVFFFFSLIGMIQILSPLLW